MKYEVEVKYPLEHPEVFREKLLSLGARFHTEVAQEDLYFGHPQRDFASTDEAFRIRRNGDQNRITYKGPLLDMETKSRQEYEIGLEPGREAAVQFEQILQHLGFQPVYRVSKVRQIFELETGGQEFEVVIDTVADLGIFAEIEATATPETFDLVRSRVLALAEQLQLGPTVERRSYLRLLLQKMQ
ncbi:MAG: class IV adenylate cyclase [Planctomycetaceae bacterium]|nr:class IV adenylate cyclase [Planctomycetaceae bacterium]